MFLRAQPISLFPRANPRAPLLSSPSRCRSGPTRRRPPVLPYFDSAEPPAHGEARPLSFGTAPRRLHPTLFGQRLTSPIFSSICRASSMPLLTTRPYRRLGTLMSRRPPSPSLSTHRSGEPSPPLPCKACCRHPHGAHAALPRAPCSSASPGWPRHLDAARVATVR
jgi:hypothetical protein